MRVMLRSLLLLAGLGLAALLASRRRTGPDPAKGNPWLEPSSKVPGFDFAGLSRFRYDLGGDFHDLVVPPQAGCPADEHRVVVAVGDVAGHDGLASRLMVLSRDLLRARRACPGELGAMVAAVNRDLAPHMKAGRFMSLFLAVLVSETRSIHWVNAGQGEAIAFDPVSDSFREVGGPDIPLGIDPQWNYTELSHTGWPTGALLVIGTDGVWETRAPDGEMYGTERLCHTIRGAAKGSAAEIVAAIASDLDRFRAGMAQVDDLTVVVVKAV